MATTTNFGWETPDDTDLVKDGALAIRTLGSAIDTSLVDLKGGTTGQILSKTSNTDMDFTWINNDQGDITAVTAGTGISGGGTSGAVTITNSMATEITASGDIIVGTGSGTFDNLPIGTTGQVLTADTTVSPYKVKWATAGGGDMVKVASGSFSAASTITVDNCFTSTYNRYVVYATLGASAVAATRIQLRYGTTTETGNYYGSGFQYARNNTLTTFGSNPTSGNIPLTSGTGANVATIVFANVGTGSSQEAAFYGNGIGNNSQEAYFFSGKPDTARDYTGFLISGASGTFTGSYSVYGLKD